MNTLSRWKVIVSLLAIFVAGGVAGSFLTLTVAQRQVRQRNDPEHWVDATMARWNRRLNLTAQQSAQLRPILADTARDMRELRIRDIHETEELMRRTRERLEPILDAKQRETLRHMQEARWRRVQRWMNAPH